MSKKSFKVLSMSAVAAIITASTIVAVAPISTEAVAVNNIKSVIVQKDGKLYQMLYKDYTGAKGAGMNLGTVRYVVGTNNKEYKITDFTGAKTVTAEKTAVSALALLDKDPTNAQNVNPGEVTIDSNGKVEYVDEKGEFEVDDIVPAN